MCIDDQVKKVSRIIATTATTAKAHEFRPQKFIKHLRNTKDRAEVVHGVSKLYSPESDFERRLLKVYCEVRQVLSLTIVTLQSTKGWRAHRRAGETRMPENHWRRTDPLHHERQLQSAWESVRPTRVGRSSA